MTHKLSICIPTYNRLNYLRESLEVLLPQAEVLGVEVCISDNCSDDGTAKYLAEKAKDFNCLNFIVQEKNQGLDRNMVFVLRMATGFHLLPIGDDDILPAGSLVLILSALSEELDVLVLDGWHTDPYLVKKRRHLPLGLQGVCFSSPCSAFVALWDKMPFGSFLARRDFIAPNSIERYIGTSHAYTGAVWDYLSEKYQKTGQCHSKCMSTPTVLLRGGEKSWRTDSARIILHEIPLWFRLLPKDYETVIDPILKNYLQQNSRIFRLLEFHVIDQLDVRNVEELTAEFSIDQQKKAKFAVTVPMSIARLAINAKKGVLAMIKAVKWFRNKWLSIIVARTLGE